MKERSGLLVSAAMGMCVALLVAACAHVPAKNIPQKPQTDAAADAAGSVTDDYILGPDDILKITTLNHPEWSGDYLIDPAGKITIQSLGEFTADGLVKGQLVKVLTDRLSQYINNPQVTIGITKYSSEVVYVFGEVARPGKYATDGKRLTVRDVLINAGLPTKTAALSRTFIITASRGKPKKRVVNMDRVLNHGELKMNIEVKPGDVVYVPQTILGMIGDFISSLLSPLSSAGSARIATGTY